MNQKVRNTEGRLIFIFTDDNLYLCTILFDDNAVNGKRQSNPLIFFDAAIIMSER